MHVLLYTRKFLTHFFSMISYPLTLTPLHQAVQLPTEPAVQLPTKPAVQLPTKPSLSQPGCPARQTSSPKVREGRIVGGVTCIMASNPTMSSVLEDLDVELAQNPAGRSLNVITS